MQTLNTIQNQVTINSIKNESNMSGYGSSDDHLDKSQINVDLQPLSAMKQKMKPTLLSPVQKNSVSFEQTLEGQSPMSERQKKFKKEKVAV